MADPSHSSVLILAGMHRSLTSLVAKSFHASGLYLGDDLIGASASNPDGHFEDRRFVSFHKSIIKEKGLQSWWSLIDRNKAGLYALSNEFYTDAKDKFSNFPDKAVIGWKDPRTALFIEGWNRVIPNSFYILIMRHPVNCVHSLIRRSTNGSVLRYRPFLATRYFNLWDVTNRFILDFVLKHPDRCILLHTPDDLLDPDVEERVNQVIIEKWKLALSPISFKEHVNQDYIRSQEKPKYLNLLYRLRSNTRHLYTELRKHSIGVKSA